MFGRWALGMTFAALLVAAPAGAEISWLGGAGSWDDGSKWSGGKPPGVGDTAVIEVDGSSVLLDSDVTVAALTIGNGTGAAVLETGLNDLTVDGPLTVAAGSELIISDGAALGGTGDHQIDGHLDWRRGSVTGSGTTTIGSGGQLTTGGYSVTLGRDLVVHGTASFSTDQMFLSGAVLRIAASGAVTLSDGYGLSGVSPDELIVEGVLDIQAGTGTSRVTVPLRNDGALRVLSGAFELTVGRQSHGDFEVSSGATLTLGNNLTLTADGTISGQGDVAFKGNVTVEGPWTVSGTVSLLTGRATFNGPATSFGHLLADGGALDGSADLTVTDRLDWDRGRFDGTGRLIVDSAATVVADGTIGPTLGRPLELNGLMELSAPSFGMTETASILIATNARLDLKGDVGDIGSSTTGDLIEVHGELIKSAGTGEARITAAVDNHGLVRVATGRLDIQGGGSSTGRFEVPAGTVLELSSATQTTLDTGSEVDAAGDLEVTGRATVRGVLNVSGRTSVEVSGRLTLDGSGPYAFPQLDVLDSQVLGSAAVQITESALLDSCFLKGDGSFEIGTGASASLVNGIVLERPLVLAGAATVDGSSITFSTDTASIEILASGSLDLQGDTTIGSSATTADLLTNAGALTKSGGTGYASLYATCTNTGQVLVTSGELRARSGGRFTQTAGETRLDGATLGADGSTIRIEGGALTGDGTVNGNLSNTGGTVAPGLSPGTLAVAGDYTQAAGGTLQAELAGTSAFDTLQITGQATLAGTLELIVDPAYTPVSGDAFELLTGAAVSGTFDPVNVTGGGAATVSVDYSATAVTATLLIPVLPTYEPGPRHVEVVVPAGQLYVGTVAPRDRSTGGLTLPEGAVDPWGQTAAALSPPVELGLDRPELDGLLLAPDRRPVAPQSRAYTGSPTIQARTLAFSVASSTVSEGVGTVSVTVELTTTNGAPSDREATVEVSTADGTAAAGTDYNAVSVLTLTFPSGSVSGATVPVEITIQNDLAPEPEETFSLLLAHPSGARLTTPAEHVVTLTDDDAPPALTIADTASNEGDSGATDAVVTVSLSEAATDTVTVDWTTVPGTASVSDFTSSSGTLTLEPPETSVQLSVPVRGDELAEQDETFQVQLANPVGAVLDDDLAVVTIFDDDALPSASISDSHLCESSGSRMPFLVRLSAPAGYTITLEFSTSDGTASTADYTPNAGALTIPAGSTRSKVRVDVLDDNILEDDETLTVALSAPQGVSLSRDLATGTILDDEGLGAPGDTNGDCSFDASDLSRTIRKLTDPPFVVPGNADCNGNGLISTPDLTCILRARVFGR